MKTYTTKQGDLWDGIAYTQLGSVAYTDVLMRENANQLPYFTFPAGVILTIPEIDNYPESDEDTTPPWKAVAG